ncbi:ubiquinol oxidase subunit II [Parafrankia sp. BMG5.11]|uniref:ubiquinol oxidase subunit II n=1 Tax=Parafrankia sp. BMG5.11 TaxID=222540 RepID=UPI001038E401|nr:ubiquinol oxidase subunit II [Parafrankia sp. BMG5.11]TCJ39774.1 ubiquinol oxidase subunit II [Parafrankia sp. BMG5.11]
MLQHIPVRIRRLKAALLIPLVAILAACDRAVLNPAGDVARQQRDIIYISTGLMLLIIVPVMLLIVVFAWRYRKGAGGTYDPDFDHSTSLELVIWSVPLLIIIILGALTWSSTHLLDPFRPLDMKANAQEARAPVSDPLRVQVVSLDWKWLFIYPEQGIATVNELALPVDRQVRFDLTSTNMMNTFYAPTMAGMIYVMPGMQSTLHAVLNRPGSYEGLSANYSGHGFADMRFQLKGMDQAAFDNWVAQAKASGRTLDLASYYQLAKPSEKVPPMFFGSVDQDLYRRVLERCVEPGTPCMTDLMEYDRKQGGGHPHETRPGAGMPQRGNSMPMHGPKAEGALLREPSEKGSGANVTKPANPADAGGATRPNDPRNRDMSALDPRSAPFARADANA